MRRGHPVPPLSLEEIVGSGLCIGCGLCLELGEVKLETTRDGVERPTGNLSAEATDRLNQICPGLKVQVGHELAAEPDPMWGAVARLVKGHAADPEIRYRGASGGVLTALGSFLVDSGRVEQVVHVAADKDRPLRSGRKLSAGRAGLLEGTGSRYGPAAPLSGLQALLDQGEKFAVILKPCDIAGVRNLARVDPRVDELVPYKLALACGGASRLTKSWELLAEVGVEEDEVTLFRYRGHGNPGPTRVETEGGAVHEFTYGDVWADERTWDLQWRCKLCPDGMGEVADLVSLDCWPGGSPSGEDDGFNSIIARTHAGAELLEAAIQAGVITLTDTDLGLDHLADVQPHQERRKRAVLARYAAMRQAGLPAPTVSGLHLDEVSPARTSEGWVSEFHGTRRRIQAADPQRS